VIPDEESITLSYPLIVKIPHLYSSVGLDEKSVVSDYGQLKKQLLRMADDFG